LRVQVVHFAVWVSAQLRESSAVERLLPYLSAEDVFAKAKYQARPGSLDETWLDPIHIAAGLGAVPAMEVLLKHVVETAKLKTPEEYVNTQCLVHKITGEGENRQEWNENYYQPLHDATNAGIRDVSMWLLEHKADARAKNKDGVTPLHFVALRGINGGLEADEELTKLVQVLLRGGASLEARIPAEHPDKLLRGQIPLQLASTDRSRFPKHMMHLLAPCLNKQNQPGFFSDVSFVASLNTEAAEEVVHELVRRALKQPEMMHSFRLDAQLPGRTDIMAGILYIAPAAAADMLDMLIVEPEVQDVAKHNIPTRTGLSGYFSNPTMRCIYRPDVITRDSVLLPCWRFDSQKDYSQQPNIRWHSQFMPEVSKSRSSRDVHNVSVKATMLPNMLDMDIIMALAQIAVEDMSVFLKLSVRGILYCLWDNLLEQVWIFMTFLHMLELAAYIWWGLSGLSHIMEDLRSAACWVVMAAGGFRELSQIVLLTYNWRSKYHAHDVSIMRSMWDLSSNLYSHWCVPTGLLALLQLAFAWCTQTASSEVYQLAGGPLMLLVTIVLCKSWLLIYMSRLHAVGVRIHAISNSLTGGATRQMMAITLMIFASFCLAFLILARSKDHGWVLASAYRGLLFGDGSGLDNLGLNVDEEEYARNDVMLCGVNLIGSTFFNIIILNLIIAVYSNEYDKVQHEVPLYFLHARAKYCVMYYLSCNLLQWRSEQFKLFVMLAAVAAAAAAMVACALWPFWSFWSLALLLSVAQSLIAAAMVQCEWFSMEGVAFSNQEHFIWICHKSDLVDHSLLDSSSSHQEDEFQDRLAEVRALMESRCRGIESQVAQVDRKLDSILAMLEETE